MPAALLVLLLCGIVASATMIRITLVADQYSDFGVLHASGRAALHGQPLYELPEELQHTGAYNLNPPHVTLFVLAPLGALPLRTAALVLWAVMALSVLGVVRLLGGILPGYWPAGVIALILPSAASYAAVRFINLAWPMALAFTLAWIWMRQGRGGRAGVLVGMLASVKVFLWLFVPYFIWRRQWRAAFAATAAGVALFGAGVLVGGIENTRAWFDALGVYQGEELEINLSLYAVLTRALTSNRDFAQVLTAPGLVQPLWVLGAALILGSLWWRFRSTEDIDAEWASVLLAALLISPIGWIYYLPLAIGPVAATLLTRPVSRTAIVGLVLLLVPHLLLTAGQPNPWLTVTLGSAYGWGAFLIWQTVIARRDPRPRGNSETKGRLVRQCG